MSYASLVEQCSICGVKADKDYVYSCKSNECHEIVCSICVAKQNGVSEIEGYDIDECEPEEIELEQGEDEIVQCKKCLNDDEDDEVLLLHALELLNIDRRTLITSYRTSNNLS